VRGPWHLLGVAVLAQLGVSVVDQGLPTLTGFVKADLGVSAATAGLVVSCFSFGRIFGSYGAGVAADRLGEKRVLVVGGVATGLLVGGAVAGPLPLLFPLLVLAGMAGAASTPAGGRLVLLAFPRERHGLALGIRQCGIPLGGLVAAALLPRIAHAWTWRWSLAAAGALTIAFVLPLTRVRVEQDVEAVPHRSTDRHPVRDRNVLLLTAWSCLVVTGQYAVLAFLALYLHQAGRLSLAAGSLLVVFANACGILGRILWGAISDRALGRGRKPLLLALTSAGLGSALLLALVPPSAPLGLLVAVAGLAGLALIGYQGLWVTMLAEAAGPARVGAATGFAITFVTAAIASTAPLYGLAADLAGTYRAVWVALSCVLLAAFLPASLVRERR
jgi:predicted MFS family arabinose efflux permease